MGLLSELSAETPHGGPEDVEALRDVLSIMGSVDGRLDHDELAIISALFRTVPQLKAHPAPAAPPRTERGELLVHLAGLSDERLRRQCFVLAVEVALASEGAHQAEDRYVEELREALRLDPGFARQVIEVIACKYARAR